MGDLLGLGIGLVVVLGLVILGFSLAMWLFGYRIFKVILGFIGFTLGAGITGAIVLAVSQDQTTAVIAGIVGGVIGASLMIFLHFVGVFIIGGLLGALLITVVSALGGSNPQPAVMILSVIIFGVLAIIFQKFIIIIYTSFNGALGILIPILLIVTAAMGIDPGNMLNEMGGMAAVVFLLWLAMGIFGALYQYGVFKGGKEKGTDTEQKVEGDSVPPALPSDVSESPVKTERTEAEAADDETPEISVDVEQSSEEESINPVPQDNEGGLEEQKN